MEAMAIVLMLMKPDHSMMELGKYESTQQCEQALEIAKTQFKKGHLSCIKEGEKMKH
tara:strand:+ start:58 stop:228 length:171 start_codon:yes stop_codon:yes gene_type:complete